MEGLRGTANMVRCPIFYDCKHNKADSPWNKAAQGTTLHPSVYLILDEYSNVFLDRKALSFRSHIEGLRSTVLSNDIFWSERETVDIEEPGAIRILVCGNTGVGKSTLINEVFGVQVVRSAYIVHSLPSLTTIPTDEAFGTLTWSSRHQESNHMSRSS